MIKIEHIKAFDNPNQVWVQSTLYTDGINCLFLDKEGLRHKLPLDLFLAIEELVRQNAMFRTQVEENHSHDHDHGGCGDDQNPMGYVALTPEEVITLNQHFTVDEIIQMKEAGVY